MRYWQRAGRAEMAQRLGIGEDGVKMLLRRIREALAKCVSGKLECGNVVMEPLDPQDRLVDSLLSELAGDRPSPGLRERILAEAFPEPAAEPRVSRPRSGRRWAWLAVAAAAAVLLLGLGVMFRGGGENTATVSGVRDPYLAVVIDQSPDARWAGKDAPQGLGHALGRARARLESGEATLQLDNGVELLLRGPAELELHSVDHATLYRGQLSARVPATGHWFSRGCTGAQRGGLGHGVLAGGGWQRTAESACVQGQGARGASVIARLAHGIDRGRIGPLRCGRRQGESRAGRPRAVSRHWRMTRRLPRTTGDVRFLRRAPESVRAGTYRARLHHGFRRAGGRGAAEGTHGGPRRVVPAGRAAAERAREDHACRPARGCEVITCISTASARAGAMSRARAASRLTGRCSAWSSRSWH